MDHSDRVYLEKLTKLIESELKWGPSEKWTGKDFQKLSDMTFERTEKRLSVTTLKRLWGRATLDSQPSVSTLDILAEFGGKESWRKFCNQFGIARSPGMRKRTGVLAVVLVGVLLFLTMRSAVVTDGNSLDFEPPEKVDFSFEKVTMGYPNTVIFKYDIGDAEFDTLLIQQSWDQSKQIPLKNGKGLVTSTYYFPGYYLTKLIMDGHIISENELYIPTDGWQGMLIGEMGDFTYLPDKLKVKDGVLTFFPGLLHEMNANEFDYLYLANLSVDPDLPSTDFIYETEFRLAEAMDNSICNAVKMVITGTKEVLNFTFSRPGCVGDLVFFLNMEMISGKENDLSAFGIHYQEWVDFRLENRNNKLTVFINDRNVFEHQMMSDIGSLGGVQWFFEGLGEIRKLDVVVHENRHSFLEYVE